MKRLFPILAALVLTASTPAIAQKVACANDFSGCTNGVIALPSGVAAANPTATAGPTAVNGSATTFLRSDGAPAIQLGTSGQKGIVQGDGSTVSLTAGVLSVTNAIGAPTVSGGYTYIPLPGGYYWDMGGLNSAGSGVAVVTLPHAFASGVTSSGATTGAISTIVWGPVCNGPPVTICTWTVTDLTGTVMSGVPVYWWAVGF